MREHGHGSAFDEYQICFEHRALAALTHSHSGSSAKWMAGTCARP
jgi:hypothetical protein